MTPQEATLSDSDTWAAQVWAAKEAIYKLYGRREVELTGDIAITAYDASTSQLTATVRSTSHMVVRTQIIEDSVVVATATFK